MVDRRSSSRAALAFYRSGGGGLLTRREGDQARDRAKWGGTRRDHQPPGYLLPGVASSVDLKRRPTLKRTAEFWCEGQTKGGLKKNVMPIIPCASNVPPPLASARACLLVPDPAAIRAGRLSDTGCGSPSGRKASESISGPASLTYHSYARWRSEGRRPRRGQDGPGSRRMR